MIPPFHYWLHWFGFPPLPPRLGESGQRFIKFIFPESQLLLSLIFLTVACFLVSISFMSALYYDSFLQLTLDFILFIVPLGISLSRFFEIFFLFPHWACIGINFSLTIAFLHPIDFGSLWFCFHFSPDIILFSLWYVHWPTDCLVSYGLAMFLFFAVFSYSLFLVQ